MCLPIRTNIPQSDPSACETYNIINSHNQTSHTAGRNSETIHVNTVDLISTIT